MASFFKCLGPAPDAVAVEAVDSPVRYTYRQLDQRACQVAHWALSRGLQQGDVVRLHTAPPGAPAAQSPHRWRVAPLLPLCPATRWPSSWRTGPSTSP